MGFSRLVALALIGCILCTGCYTGEQRDVSPVSVSTPTATLTATVTEPATATPIPSDVAVVASLRDLIIPLTTVDPHAPLDDLIPFGALVSDASIIGLGESTHGTDEFMHMRHRIIRYLVERGDLRAVAFEAPVAGIEIVNQYVQGELDDPVAAQSGLSYFILRNTAVWDLIEWLRSYNAISDDSARVHIFGIDPQNNTTLAPDLIVSLMESVAFAEVDQLRSLYVDVQGQTGSTHAFAQAQLAVDVLLESRDALIAALSTATFEDMLHLAEMVVDDQLMLVEQTTNPESLLMVFEHREAVMAENVKRIVERFKEQQQIVVWGHNWHVGLGQTQRYREVMTLGERLRDRYGEAYRVVGFDFASGSFTARSGTGSSARLTTFPTEPLPPTHYASRFQQLGVPIFLLDLQSIDRTSPAGWWLGERRSMWAIGCCYTPLNPQSFYIDLIDTFDMLIFIEETNPTSLLPSP